MAPSDGAGGGGVAAAAADAAGGGCVRTGGLAVDARMTVAGGVDNCEAKEPLAAVLGEAVWALGGGTTAAGGGVSAPTFLLTHRFSTGSYTKEVSSPSLALIGPLPC